MYRIEPHQAYEIPTIEQIQLLARAEGIEDAEAFAKIDTMRREQIRLAKKKPLWNMFEPPIWTVCDALLGFPWLDEDVAREIREYLGFDSPISSLLINGGQRGGKSEYALNRGMRILSIKDKARAWFLHSNNRMSVEYQQPLAYKFLPAELKARDVREKVANIVYTVKRGFTDNRFVLPNGSDGTFLTYQMDDETVEGGNVDFINPDELVPSDWVETMELRIAERNGVLIGTFTPVKGYTDTVQMFQAGAEIVHESTAFLLPKDGGDPDVGRAMRLTDIELANMHRYLDKRWDPKVDGKIPCPWSRPEECLDWLKGESGQESIPEGREFEMLPRVMRCVSKKNSAQRAVVFFYSSDNPYGNPLQVWRTISKGNRSFIKERFYGYADKTISARFPKFSRAAHVMPHADIPTGGTNYLIVDPCSGRNMFMVWIRVTSDGEIYVYREWPNQWDYVPGIGVMGPWAEPCGKHPDGRKGDGQECLGWGLAQYKQEIARMEEWEEYKKYVSGESDTASKNENEVIAEWDEHGKADEVIEDRYLDAAFANVKQFSEGGQETLFDQFDDIGLTFNETIRGSRSSIDDGIIMINDALYYDDEQPISFFNHPKLHISDRCHNLIFALKTWTGKDGQKGACKDPVDCLRMFFLKRLEYVDEQTACEPAHGRYQA